MINGNAQFIAADTEPDSAPLFRRDFSLETGHGQVESAVLSLSALGICEAWINGVPVSEDLLSPGWTSYEWRLHYVDHDVTALIDTHSTLGIAVGNGWYRGRLGWIETKRYGNEIAAYAELRIRFADGYEQVVATDQSWQVGPSDITSNDLYDGQTVDARRRDDKWTSPGFSDPRWGSVHAVDYRPERFELDTAPPVRRIDQLLPQKVWLSPTGSILIDFGQNIVGFVRLRIAGRSGDVITVRHAEVLEDGELAMRTLRSAKCTDHFILSGGDDVFEPTFTFHGFRYAELRGWDRDLEEVVGAVTAIVISSDLQRIGHFECSVPDLNQLHDNAIRGMRGNFVDIPTDCPQRDERLGWTGDIATFAPTAAFLFDVKDLLADWLEDLHLEQDHHDGVVPYIVPDILKYAVTPQAGAGAEEAAAVWSDAAVWVPWALWVAYGDPRVLEASFDSMLTHGRRVHSLLSPTGVWDSGFQFGDWLDPDAPADRPGDAKADPGVVATACAFRTADRIRAAAEILGRNAEAAEFAAIARGLRAAFQREYIHGERVFSDSTTVYSLAIVFGLLDSPQTRWAGDRLAALVAASGFHISTGFAGTPFICDALTSTGHVTTAYRLLLQRECPSWLYPVSMGATTIWERWDSMLPDGSINPGDMTSFNHYALGAVADWMHREIGGLAPLDPGYQRILVAPKVDAGIDWARTSLLTPHGRASVDWSRDDDMVDISITVPVGASAIMVWPNEPDRTLGAGQHSLRVPAPIARAAATSIG
ncbi:MULTISPECIES: alpha-L-rhamnosidase [unclassified Microbacterium]|uniref:alpha-L-rhamnosidase n=1 Tax=unclassified Microbacterium TaxID=2609290 RepID=UPI00214B3240|nr:MULTISPECIES: alpha-L-rhamnosidase [unclassified Microbacterium]MCR2783547.1 glycoside hydrolase family 78 protein [Microbacterium sp. zg.B96]WIM15592.1 family 78 glycoside hydrolase catalytic domain [Microbacterium sp. zg-B96]